VNQLLHFASSFTKTASRFTSINFYLIVFLYDLINLMAGNANAETGKNWKLINNPDLTRALALPLQNSSSVLSDVTGF